MLKSIQLDIITIIVQFICISIYKSRRESVLKLEMSSKFLICTAINYALSAQLGNKGSLANLKISVSL